MRLCAGVAEHAVEYMTILVFISKKITTVSIIVIFIQIGLGQELLSEVISLTVFP